MRRTWYLLVLVAALVAATGACTSRDPDVSTGASGSSTAPTVGSSAPDGTTVTLDAVTSPAEGDGIALVGPTYTLTSIEAGDAVSSLPAGVEAPTLVFADDGTVAVFTGCNRGSTTYEQGAGSITFGPLATTKMACEPAAQELESTVTAVLGGPVRVTRVGADLTLATRDQSLVFTAS